jgi:hypothetical protein
MELPSQAFPDPTLPRGVWKYQVDVRPREPMTLEINGAIGGGSFREAMLYVDHPDANRGQRDIADMFVWGDVDPNFHPRIATAYDVGNPIRFQSRIPLLFSAGAGTKTINVRLRFISGRYIEDAVTYDLLDDVPHVSILWGPFREYIPQATPVTIAWSCSHAVSQIYVGLADAYDTPRSGCALLTSGTNVNTSGSWAAGEKIESTFSYADAAAAMASLADTGNCFVKIFAVTSIGETS